MARAVILGGTGLIGRAAARRMLAAGWDVAAVGRDRSGMPEDVAAAGGRFVAADRYASSELQAALGAGADLLIDCLCFTAAHARGLLPLLDDVGSTVMISTKAVYIDAVGNHVNSAAAPNFDGPIRESQPTMAPRQDIDYRSSDGYGANKVAAERVLLDSGHPVTVLRPSRVHGDGTATPAEWVFVKRARPAQCRRIPAIRLDLNAARQLGYQPAGDYATTVTAELDWLVSTTQPPPRLDHEHFAPMLDYAAEDDYLARQ